MRRITLLFLLLAGFISCISQANKKSSEKYESIIEQADTLKKYYDRVTNTTGDEREKYEKLFFEAFPSSFNRMKELYGFDEKKGEAPLYSYPVGENHIYLFANLKYIDTTLYYNKYINICIGGKWEGDNIREGFGIYDKIYYDTKKIINVLSMRTEKEIRSVFHFVFDGPHPEKQRESFDSLFVKVQKINPSMAELMKQEYEKLLKESDGHGH